MTDQSITQSEFQRFQDQLISLKEGKYKTEEKCEILCRNIKTLEMKCAGLEKELLKANEFKNKIRGAKDLEILMDDNQVLRDRMSATESNFKLQNEILRTECERLYSENERLKCQMETYKLPSSIQNAASTGDVIDGIGQEEQRYKIRSLQFEVAKLIEEKEKGEIENNNLKKLLTDSRDMGHELAVRVDSLLNDKSKLMTENVKIKDEIENVQKLNADELKIIYKNHLDELHEASLQHEKILDVERKSMIELRLEMKQLVEKMETEFHERSEVLNEEWREQQEKYESTIDEWRRKADTIVVDWQMRLDEKDLLHKEQIVTIDAANLEKIVALETEVVRLQDSLHFAEEELKVYGKKNQKMLKDVKKQLEKEMKISQEVQSRLEVQSSENSQNSQTKVHEYLGGNHQVYSTDDQSSLHSSSYNGAASDGQWSSSSIAVTDEELRNLLDRLTNVQNDYCEYKRKIETLNQEKNQLIETIKRQEKIILNYIKNRGGNDSNDMSPDEGRHRPTTSESLTLNGLMSSPVHSKTSLSSLLSKVKETMKALSPPDLMSMATGPDKFSYRVTDVDVRQLQRVCEELMMRCLNLETDLQSAVDLNVRLSSSTAVVAAMDQGPSAAAAASKSSMQ